MCFIIQKTNPRVLIADKDIVCYKELREYLTARYNSDFKYRLNELHTVSRLTPSRTGTSWGMGGWCKDDFSLRKIYINQGFHSYIDEPECCSGRGYIQVKCIIPKGARYFINKFRGEYISNKIIIKEMI